MKEVFPVYKSILSSESLKTYILSEYDLSLDCKCSFFKAGYNDTYKVKDLTNDFYLRIYTSNWRTKSDIEAEVKLINQLYKNDVSVAIPVKNKNNEYIMEINAPEGIRYSVLFESATGLGISEIDEIKSGTYGKFVASTHNVLDNIEVVGRYELNMEHLLEEPLKIIEPFLLHRKSDLDYLRKTTNALRSKIFEMDSSLKLNYGICHGDFHYGNVHFDMNGDITVFDFDCFGSGWRAYDLSVFLWSCVSQEKWEPKDLEKRMLLWEAFIENYASIRTISDNEVKASFVFVAIRHIWVLGLQASRAPQWGQAWINDASFDEGLKFLKRWLNTYKILD